MKRMDKNYVDGNVYVKGIRPKGLGVFAKSNIKVGDVIEAAPTIILPPEDDFLVSNTHLVRYVFSDSSGDASVIGLGNASLYNHSNHPNAEYLIGNRIIIIKATRDIKKDSEILIDYGWETEDTKDFI